MRSSNLLKNRLIANPFARSVAKATAKAAAAKVLREAMRELQLRLHLLRDGDDVSGYVWFSLQVLRVCEIAMKNSGHGDHWSISQIHRSSLLLDECAARGHVWRETDAAPVDRGLECLVDLYPQLDDEIVKQAWVEFRAQQQSRVVETSETGMEILTP